MAGIKSQRESVQKLAAISLRPCEEPILRRCQPLNCEKLRQLRRAGVGPVNADHASAGTVGQLSDRQIGLVLQRGINPPGGRGLSVIDPSQRVQPSPPQTPSRRKERHGFHQIGFSRPIGSEKHNRTGREGQIKTVIGPEIRQS